MSKCIFLNIDRSLIFFQLDYATDLVIPCFKRSDFISINNTHGVYKWHDQPVSLDFPVGKRHICFHQQNSRKLAYSVMLDFGLELGEKHSPHSWQSFPSRLFGWESGSFVASIWSVCISVVSKVRCVFWKTIPNRALYCSLRWNWQKGGTSFFEAEKHDFWARFNSGFHCWMSVGKHWIVYQADIRCRCLCYNY